MRLRRSDSSASQWILHSPDHKEDDDLEIRDQRRLRHLSAIMIRNLTLNPRHDQMSSLLRQTQRAAAPTTTGSAAGAGVASSTASVRPRATDDADLFLRSSAASFPSIRRKRAGSSASAGSGGAARTIPEEWRQDVETSTGSPGKRTRPRRSSSGGGMSLNEAVIAEESGPTASSEPPEPDSYFSPHASASLFATLGRARSTSRASATSLATTASGSTIRQSGSTSLPGGAVAFSADSILPQTQKREVLPPSLATLSSQRHYSASDVQLERERRKRAETLRRRLLDSAITLELGSRPYADSSNSSPVIRSRQRGDSSLWSNARGTMLRSGSSSSLKNGVGLGLGSDLSPRRPTARGRTHSSPAFPAAAFANSAPSCVAQAPEPFYVSSTCCATMHPAFTVSPAEFIVPTTSCDAADRASDDDSTADSWSGLRSTHVRVKVWVKESEERRSSPIGKGKGKEPASDSEFSQLLEWDVDFAGLTSLGRDPTAFPALPPNTIIFALQNTLDDREYFTAPLPSQRRRRAGTRRRGRSLSSESSCSSCEDDDDLGNLSDPGGGGGTISLRGGRGRRRRRDAELAEEDAAVEAEEEQRRRRVMLERSARETRMIRAAGMARVERLICVESEARLLREEVIGTSRRIDEALGGEDGVLTLNRASNELRDHVDDLVSVREDLKLDIADTRGELDNRREVLRARRARLEQAQRLLDQQRQSQRKAEDELREHEVIREAVQTKARSRRTQLITLLSHIFPVEPVLDPPAFIPEASHHLLFSILNIALPNSSFPPTFSDEALSSALGYTGQVVSTLAAYLGVPLHYPIKCLGSRSAVLDPISMMRGPRAFPLYGKGVDRYRFDYGVFLLNKNIEQLMYSQSLTVIDLRNTLPNLKSLLLTLSFDPSHADFTSTLVAPESDRGLNLSTNGREASGRPNTSSPSDEGSMAAPPAAFLATMEASTSNGHSEGHSAVTDDESDQTRPRSPAPSTVKGTSIRSLSPASSVSTVKILSTSSNGLSTSVNGHGGHGSVGKASGSKRSELKLFGGRGRSRAGSASSVEKVVEAARVREGHDDDGDDAPRDANATIKARSSKSRVSSGGSRIASSLWSAVGYRE